MYLKSLNIKEFLFITFCLLYSEIFTIIKLKFELWFNQSNQSPIFATVCYSYTCLLYTSDAADE